MTTKPRLTCPACGHALKSAEAKRLAAIERAEAKRLAAIERILRGVHEAAHDAVLAAIQNPTTKEKS